MNSLAEYPNNPGFKTAGPSQEAAIKETSRAVTLRVRVLEEITKQSLTADECAALLNESVLAIRPRVTELLKQGKIADAGVRRPNASGHRATVWKLAMLNQTELL